MEEYIVYVDNVNQQADIVQELVRCKDCKHYDTTDCFWKLETGCNQDEDWFCADGER